MNKEKDIYNADTYKVFVENSLGRYYPYYFRTKEFIYALDEFGNPVRFSIKNSRLQHITTMHTFVVDETEFTMTNYDIERSLFANVFYAMGELVQKGVLMTTAGEIKPSNALHKRILMWFTINEQYLATITRDLLLADTGKLFMNNTSKTPADLYEFKKLMISLNANEQNYDAAAYAELTQATLRYISMRGSEESTLCMMNNYIPDELQKYHPLSPECKDLIGLVPIDSHIKTTRMVFDEASKKLTEEVIYEKK